MFDGYDTITLSAGETETIAAPVKLYNPFELNTSTYALVIVLDSNGLYSTVKTQLAKSPYKFRDAEGKWHSVPRTIEWLEKPIKFARPQADLVHCRDYSFVNDEKTDTKLLSLNTLNPKRVRVTYDTPENFSKYFDGSWKFGTGKLVELKGRMVPAYTHDQDHRH